MATRRKLNTAVSDARYWAQIHALRELYEYFDNHGRLPAAPVSETDWYPAWALFDGSFSDAYPDASPDVKGAAWAAYKDAWRFVYDSLEHALYIISENIKDYISYYGEIPDEEAHWSSNQGLYLNSLPDIDDELRHKYLVALSVVHNNILRNLSQL